MMYPDTEALLKAELARMEVAELGRLYRVLQLMASGSVEWPIGRMALDGKSVWPPDAFIHAGGVVLEHLIDKGYTGDPVAEFVPEVEA